jgi:uncharacterized protein YggE
VKLLILIAAVAAIFPASLSAQTIGTLQELAQTPVVTVRIQESLKSPPDEATLSVSTQSRAPTASAALERNKVKTEEMVAAIRAAGIADKDIQTEGVSINPDYRYEQVNGRGEQRMVGYVAGNSVRIKTRRIDRLSNLLDALTAAGADPKFGIADPLPIRREARKRAMVRGEAEAMEYARNAGFSHVRLLTVEEGVSYRATDIIVTGSRASAGGLPPPPPPPQPERGGIEPGQIESGVQLTLQYRMER